jgi:hypothetical protein
MRAGQIWFINQGGGPSPDGRGVPARCETSVQVRHVADPQPAQFLAAHSVIEQGGQHGPIAHALECVAGAGPPAACAAGASPSAGVVPHCRSPWAASRRRRDCRTRRCGGRGNRTARTAPRACAGCWRPTVRGPPSPLRQAITWARATLRSSAGPPGPAKALNSWTLASHSSLGGNAGQIAALGGRQASVFHWNRLCQSDSTRFKHDDTWAFSLVAASLPRGGDLVTPHEERCFKLPW